MAAHTSPVRRATSDTHGVIGEQARDQSEHRNSTARPVAESAGIQITESETEAHQSDPSVPTKTKSPYDFDFAKDWQPAYQGKQCSLWCSCACHSRKSFCVSSHFGTLSGYISGVSLLRRRCVEYSCRCPTIPSGSVVYRSPDWFWDRLFTITVSSSPVCGPEINIRFPRVAPPSKLFLFAMHGDRKGVQDLVSEGTATPWDVNERGSSVLYVSLQLCTFSFLFVCVL